jgi:hypothetical protein
VTDYIEFNTEEITRVASATRGHEAEWNRIWEGVRSRLSGVVSEALDAQTGASLDERSAEYHRRTVQYTADLQAQQNAVTNIGNIATDTNQNMIRTIGR